MHLFEYTALTFIVAFMIQYWVISILKSKHHVHSAGKVYLSLVAASMMGILEVMIYDTYKSTVSLYYYMALGLVTGLSMYMYNHADDDMDYLKQLLESHMYEVSISKRALETSDNSQVITIANNLVHRREKDMGSIQKLLKDPNEKTRGHITKSNLFNYMDIGRGRKHTIPKHATGGGL
jgi:hypothetical protein